MLTDQSMVVAYNVFLTIGRVDGGYEMGSPRGS